MPAWKAPSYGKAYRGLTAWGDAANAWVGTRTLVWPLRLVLFGCAVATGVGRGVGVGTGVGVVVHLLPFQCCSHLRDSQIIF